METEYIPKEPRVSEPKNDCKEDNNIIYTNISVTRGSESVFLNISHGLRSVIKSDLRRNLLSYSTVLDVTLAQS